MKKFKRGLDEDSYSEFKKFWSKDIGKEIIACEYKNNKQFQICVRDNYFNVYWRGCSVLKYELKGTNHKYTIHHKYVGIENYNKKNPYVDLIESSSGDDLIFPAKNNWSFRSKIIIPAQQTGKIGCVADYLGNVRGRQNRGEKECLASFLEQEKPCWLDLEIAFSRKKDADEIKNRTIVADRIDLARIVMKNNVPTLQLVEVKLANDPRLRIRNGDPEIFNQMNRYKYEFIDKQKDQLLESYKKVAENMLDFGLIHNQIDLVKLLDLCGEYLV